MVPITRRKVILIIGVLTTFAGCSSRNSNGHGEETTDAPPANQTSGTNSQTSSPSPTHTQYEIETPAAGECEVDTPPNPPPTRELEPRPYPQYPEDITWDTAVTFAKEYESVFQYNTILIEEPPTVDEVTMNISPPSLYVRKLQNGYVVGLDVDVRTADVRTPTASPTPVPSGLRTFSTWYYLAKKVALREQFEQDLHDTAWPDFDSSDTIHCGES